MWLLTFSLAALAALAPGMLNFSDHVLALSASNSADMPLRTAQLHPSGSGFPAKDKVLNLIVPWPAGGPADAGSRILAPLLEKELGIPVVVVNKGGAGSQLGLTELARSKPDGYTLGQVPAPALMTIYKNPQRAAVISLKSFQPISAHVGDPSVLAVRSDTPYKTIKDLVDAARSTPRKIKMGMAGILGLNHLSILLLEKTAGVGFAHVNFDGGAPNMTALLGGHTDSAMGVMGDFLSQARAGELRVLGVMSKERSKFLPEVKTFEEQGYRAYMGTTRVWAAPSGTPRDAVDVLARAFKKVLADPQVVRKTEETGQLVLKYMTPAELAALWAEMDSQVDSLMTLAEQ